MSDEQVGGYPLGHHDGRSEFWQINIGHVLQIVTMLSSLAFFAAQMIREFDSQAISVNELKAAVSDIKDWRQQQEQQRAWQEQQNNEWKQEIKDAFSRINEHLERLDREVEDTPESGQPFPSVRKR